MIRLQASLDDKTFEDVLTQAATLRQDERLVIDATDCTFASPYGLAALLMLSQTRGERPALLLPAEERTLRRWMDSGFLRHAAEWFRMESPGSARSVAPAKGLCLEMTRLVKGADSLGDVERLREQLLRLLLNTLRLESRLAIGLTVALSRWCETVIDESPTGGWMMAQTYPYRERVDGRSIAVIAICEAGMTLTRSGDGTEGATQSAGRNDGDALEAVVVNAKGLDGDRFKGIRGLVSRLEGKFSVRSGTSRIAMVPQWDDDLPRRENLAAFPGIQLQVTVPGRASA